jgi:uncharacterized protein (TIGR02996 family)
MDQKEAFLRAVIEAPDDDAPRLVYADWLDDHGEPERAEFIRVQCELVRLPAGDPSRPDLERRERQLLDEFGWAWAAELGPRIDQWVYHRGFIERVEMCLECPAENILEVLRLAPVRHLRDQTQLDDLSGVVEALPHLDRLTGLEFWGLYGFKDKLMAQLLSSPHLRNLRTLILHHDYNGRLVKDKVLVEAMASPYRANLRELAVNVNGSSRGPSARVVQAMALSPHLGNLRKLNLSIADLDVKTVRALGGSPSLAGLEELDLGRCSLPGEVWDAILGLPQLSRLKWLRLHGARLFDGQQVPELRDVPAYADAFAHRVPGVDWSTEFIHPRLGGCWTGLSWQGKQWHWLSPMNRFVRAGDFDGLEEEYRRLCRQYRYGEQAAVQIDGLPFERYRQSLEQRLRRVVAGLPGNGGRGLCFRLQPGRWRGRFLVQAAAPPDTEKPYEEQSGAAPLAEIPAGDFREAAQLYRRSPLTAATYYAGTPLYLIARTVAAFGRCVASVDVPVPVSFSCEGVAFRVPAGPAKLS